MYFLANAYYLKLLDIAPLVCRCIGHMMPRIQGNILCERQIMYFLYICKCIFSLTIGASNFKLYRCIVHIMKRVLFNLSLTKRSRSNNVFSCKCIFS